jgi:hypothetical protein
MKLLKYGDTTLRIEHCWECTHIKGKRVTRCQLMRGKPIVCTYANEPIPKDCPLEDVKDIK